MVHISTFMLIPDVYNNTMMSCRTICRNLIILFIALDKKTTIKSDCGNNKETGRVYVSI